MHKKCELCNRPLANEDDLLEVYSELDLCYSIWLQDHECWPPSNVVYVDPNEWAKELKVRA
jgi:hypothetical protein